MKPIHVINEIEHSIREPYDRSKGQVKVIIDLCEKIKEKTGKEISFDNTRGWNQYVLTLDGAEYVFSLYSNVIAALELLDKLV